MYEIVKWERLYLQFHYGLLYANISTFYNGVYEQSQKLWPHIVGVCFVRPPSRSCLTI